MIILGIPAAPWSRPRGGGDPLKSQDLLPGFSGIDARPLRFVPGGFVPLRESCATRHLDWVCKVRCSFIRRSFPFLMSCLRSLSSLSSPICHWHRRNSLTSIMLQHGASFENNCSALRSLFKRGAASRSSSKLTRPLVEGRTGLLPFVSLEMSKAPEPCAKRATSGSGHAP